MDDRFCDHTALMAQFEALANKKQPSVLEFFRRTAASKLEHVEAICQPGNYELWQKFDPNRENDFKKCPCHLNLKGENIAAKKQLHGDNILYYDFIEKKVPEEARITGYAVGFNIMTLFLLLMFAFLLFGGIYARVKCLAFSSVEFITWSLLIMLSGARIWAWRNGKLRRQLQTPQELPSHKLSLQIWSQLGLIAEIGQKIIGTISAIRYIGVKDLHTVCSKSKFKTYALTYDVSM